MKKTIILFTLLLFFSAAPFACRANPFKARIEKEPSPVTKIIGSNFFPKIAVWQYKLKTKMSSLMLEAKSSGNIKPLLLLIMIAFTYGVLHAAGPGHGKAIAISYTLSKHPSWLQGMVFSTCMGMFHGISGILFVLIIRFVLKTSISQNLKTVTNITQVSCYTIITLIGIAIFIHAIYKLKKKRNPEKDLYETIKSEKHHSPILLALAIGSIPCPAVVMVMLFALSIDLIALGIVLGITISIGMAFTLSIIVALTIAGKKTSLTAISKRSKESMLIEYGIEAFSGLFLTILGILFLGANLQILFS
ncbi:MAG: hypothetical protein ABIJ24_05845 [Nitrospinota bacterium]|nr:sulfite exporter TauE/SafE family protein [Nitrospinota bacterium]